MLPRLLIVTDRYPIDPGRSPTAWMLAHLRSLQGIAEVEVVSLVRLFPRLKNLLLGGYDRRWFRRRGSLPALERPFPHVTVFHRRCLTVPDMFGWKVNPLLLLLQQRRWLRERVAAFRPGLLLVHYVHASAPLARHVAAASGIRLWIDENETLGAMAREGQLTLRAWILGELARADAVIAQCGTQEAELRRLLPGAVVHRLSLGVESRPSLPERSPWQASPPGPLRLLCVSRLDLRSKNVDTLLRAAAIVRRRDAFDIRITIAGDGFLRGWLEKLARELGISDVVDFRGWIPSAELDDIYRYVHAAVQPSEHESFGLVALEAVAAGLPLIAGARAGVVPDLVDCGAVVLAVDAVTPESLAAAILDLGMRFDELRRTADEARGGVCEQYSWEAHAQRFSELLGTCGESQRRQGV